MDFHCYGRWSFSRWSLVVGRWSWRACSAGNAIIRSTPARSQHRCGRKPRFRSIVQSHGSERDAPRHTDHVGTIGILLLVAGLSDAQERFVGAAAIASWQPEGVSPTQAGPLVPRGPIGGHGFGIGVGGGFELTPRVRFGIEMTVPSESRAFRARSALSTKWHFATSSSRRCFDSAGRSSWSPASVGYSNRP